MNQAAKREFICLLPKITNKKMMGDLRGFLTLQMQTFKQGPLCNFCERCLCCIHFHKKQIHDIAIGY